MSYTVTRQGSGHVFTLYHGRLRHRAEATYDQAVPVPGTTVTLTEHTVPAKVLRSKEAPRGMTSPSTWVELRCAQCGRKHDAIREACRVHGFPECHGVAMSPA